MDIHLLLQGKYHCADLQDDLILELNTSKYMLKKNPHNTSCKHYIQCPSMIPCWLQRRLYSGIKRGKRLTKMGIKMIAVSLRQQLH